MKKLILCTMVIAISFPLMAAWQDIVPEEHRSFLAFICSSQRVPVEIAAVIGQIESGWSMMMSEKNSNGSRDIGIFQLNSTYIEYYHSKFWNRPHPFNIQHPRHNIEVGVKYLAWLYEQTSDWTATVVAYNIGLTAYRKGLKSEAGQRYLNKVITAMKEMNQ